MSTVTLSEIIEDFSCLPIDDKEYAFDVIKKQLIEVKRATIEKRAKKTMTNHKKGTLK